MLHIRYDQVRGAEGGDHNNSAIIRMSMLREQIAADPEKALDVLFEVRVDRRTAIKLGTAGAVALGSSQVFSPEAEAQNNESCEILTPNPGVLVVDFMPVDCPIGMVVDPKYKKYGKSDWLMRMAVNSSPLPDSVKGVLSILDTITEPIQTKGTEMREGLTGGISPLNPLEELLAGLQGHGQIVGEVMQNTLTSNGIDTVPELHPIQRLYERARIESDDLGNISLFARMNTDRFINALHEHPESKIVNLSWQVGEVGIKFTQQERDENGNIRYYRVPKIEVLGAYRKDAALESLTELAKIGRTHKDKLFLVAAGNFGDQLGEAKKTLTDQGLWPTNVLTVGEANPGTKEFAPFLRFPFSAHGADIYVDSQHEIYNPTGEIGSTVATAITSAIAEKIRRTHNKQKPITPEAIIAKMRSMCRTVPHYSGVGTMLKLNPDLAA